MTLIAPNVSPRPLVRRFPLPKPAIALWAIALYLLLLASLAAAATPANAPDDLVLRAMKLEMSRSKAKLKMDNVAAPYYLEYRISDLEAFEAGAAFGALRSQQRGNARFVRVVVRIGDYKQDSYYGTGEGTVDIIPVDDDVAAIRHRLWLATDRAYKTAAEAFSAKQSVLKTLTTDEPIDDFSQTPPVELIEPRTHLPSQDFTPWVRLLEESSGLYRTEAYLQDFSSWLRITSTNSYFVNSEGTVARSGTVHYSIGIAGSTQAADGQFLQRSHQDDASDPNSLPTRDEFMKTSARILQSLKLLRDAPLADEEYRGPVLFSSDAASSVVNELIVPNLLGLKPRLGENARTIGFWSSSYKNRVLPDFIDIFDDPSLTSLAGRYLFGNYTLDDEGVQPQRVSLIEKGQLVSYLMGREPIRDFPSSNGHGRAVPTGIPIPTPGNLILTSSNPQSDATLKKRLLDLARQRDLPYALYIETLGPGLDLRLLFRIYTSDGHEELVRGGAFGDLDVRSLRTNLIAVGDTPDIENHLEAVPYSVASPALLFDELQIKRTQATKLALPEYPAPPLTETATQP